MVGTKIAGSFIALSVCIAQAGASIVFQDNFNRTGLLNGSTASTSAGSNWTTTSNGFTTDGSKVVGSFGLGDFKSSAFVPLPVVFTSGFVYTLSATVFRGASTDDTAIMIFGFFDALPSWDGNNAVDEGHAIAIAPRNNRNSLNPMLNGFTSPTDITVADGTNGTTLGVQIYETAPNAWSARAIELSPTAQILTGSGSPVAVSLSNIHTIGMISGALLPPNIDNFTLDVAPVPEPATLAALGLGAVALIRRRRS